MHFVQNFYLVIMCIHSIEGATAPPSLPESATFPIYILAFFNAVINDDDDDDD